MNGIRAPFIELFFIKNKHLLSTVPNSICSTDYGEKMVLKLEKISETGNSLTECAFSLHILLFRLSS